MEATVQANAPACFSSVLSAEAAEQPHRASAVPTRKTTPNRAPIINSGATPRPAPSESAAGSPHHGCEFGWRMTSRRSPSLRPPSSSLGCADLSYRRSEEHTSELQSLMRISYAVFSLKNKPYDIFNLYH